MSFNVNFADIAGLSWPPSGTQRREDLKRPRSPPPQHEQRTQAQRICAGIRPAPIELVLTLEEMYAGCTKTLLLVGGALVATDSSSCSGGAPSLSGPAHARGGGALALPITVAPGMRAGTTITVAAAPAPHFVPTPCSSDSASAAAFTAFATPPPPATATAAAAIGGVTLVVREAAHARFRRLGDDLLAVAPVPLLAALTGGGRVTLPRLGGGGELRVNLPEGAVVRPGQVFTLRGEGMPRASDPSRRGDLHVRVHVAFPAGLGPLTDAQRAALRAALQG